MGIKPLWLLLSRDAELKLIMAIAANEHRFFSLPLAPAAAVPLWVDVMPREFLDAVTFRTLADTLHGIPPLFVV